MGRSWPSDEQLRFGGGSWTTNTAGERIRALLETTRVDAILRVFKSVHAAEAVA